MGIHNSLFRSFRNLMDHPRFDGLRHRVPRRRLVLGYLLVAATVVPAAWYTGSDLSTVLLLLPMMAIGVGLGISVRGIADMPAKALDEFQVELRDRAYTRAYWFAAVVGIGGGVLARDVWIADQAMGYAVLVVALMLVSALPVMILAWVLPDEDLDDE